MTALRPEQTARSDTLLEKMRDLRKQSREAHDQAVAAGKVGDTSEVRRWMRISLTHAMQAERIKDQLED